MLEKSLLVWCVAGGIAFKPFSRLLVWISLFLFSMVITTPSQPRVHKLYLGGSVKITCVKLGKITNTTVLYRRGREKKNPFCSVYLFPQHHIFCFKSAARWAGERKEGRDWDVSISQLLWLLLNVIWVFTYQLYEKIPYCTAVLTNTGFVQKI